jgi:hypothetical protein
MAQTPPRGSTLMKAAVAALALICGVPNGLEANDKFFLASVGKFYDCNDITNNPIGELQVVRLTKDINIANCSGDIKTGGKHSDVRYLGLFKDSRLGVNEECLISKQRDACCATGVETRSDSGCGSINGSNKNCPNTLDIVGWSLANIL